MAEPEHAPKPPTVQALNAVRVLDVANLASEQNHQNTENDDQDTTILRHSPTVVTEVDDGGAAGPDPLPSSPEVSERLVGSPAFKAGGMGDPCPAGSIPVHLRHL